MNTRIRGSKAWLERSGDLLAQLVSEDFIAAEVSDRYRSLQESLQQRLEEFWLLLQPVFLEHGDSHENRSRYTFPMGVVPVEIREQSENLLGSFSQLIVLLSGVSDELKIELEEADDLDRKQLAEQLFPLVGSALRRAEATAAL